MWFSACQYMLQPALPNGKTSAVSAGPSTALLASVWKKSGSASGWTQPHEPCRNEEVEDVGRLAERRALGSVGRAGQDEGVDQVGKREHGAGHQRESGLPAGREESPPAGGVQAPEREQAQHEPDQDGRAEDLARCHELEGEGQGK